MWKIGPLSSPQVLNSPLNKLPVNIAKAAVPGFSLLTAFPD